MSGEKTRGSIFVAYSYNLYPKKDFRRIFEELEKSHQVTFIFADEVITNVHILEKIKSYIKSASFSIFDISDWNPNVALELGLAVGLDVDWYITFNPSAVQPPRTDVPSDIKGIDRIQYTSMTELGEKLTALIDQRFGLRKPPLDAYLDDLETRVSELLKKASEGGVGFTLIELKDHFGVDTKVLQIVVGRLGNKLSTTGQRKGTRYFWQKTK